jgi:hypothetical protein
LSGQFFLLTKNRINGSWGIENDDLRPPWRKPRRAFFRAERNSVKSIFTEEIAMTRTAGLAAVITSALALISGAASQPSPTDAWADAAHLFAAAYHSDQCRREADALNLAPHADARILIAEFARHLAAAPADARAEWRVGSVDPSAPSLDCARPAIILINLLRQSGLDAELVLVASPVFSAMDESSVAKGFNGMIVYVPALDRYVDPTAIPTKERDAFDRAIRARTTRVHFYGPPVSPAALERCADICMRVVTSHPSADTVRVKTEVIHR